MAIPDEQIFPHATGEAEKTVEKHQEPQDLVFYAGWVGACMDRFAYVGLSECSSVRSCSVHGSALRRRGFRINIKKSTLTRKSRISSVR